MKRSLLCLMACCLMGFCLTACGSNVQETEAVTTQAATETEREIIITEAPTIEPTTEEEPETESEKETPARIGEEAALKIIQSEFGMKDTDTGVSYLYTYQEITKVDNAEYYNYSWEDSEGNYYCNVFVRTDGSDFMTGIYADGRWQIGSDEGEDWDEELLETEDDAASNDSADDEEDWDEEYFEEDPEDWDEEYFEEDPEDWDEEYFEEEPYDDGFGEIDPNYEEPAEDETEEFFE